MTSSHDGAAVMLVEYGTYAEAQAAVDLLSDEGFPVQQVSIVWEGLRKVEYVTGRRTVLNAVIEGAMSGLWFGAFIGLLLSLFVELDDGVSTISVVLSYAAVGAVIVAIWRGIGHALKRGQRDFGAVGTLEARSYQIWVDPEMVGRARELLAV